MLHAVHMERIGIEGSTETLDRLGRRGPVASDDPRGGIILSRFREFVPAAEVIVMSQRMKRPPTASDVRPRGTAGLGAITVMFFTVVVYAAIFGAFGVGSSVGGYAGGHDERGRLAIGLMLLTPAATLLIAKLRRPARRCRGR